jgi:RNA polymerase sigma-70 factor (ECF subfamily)
MGTIILANMPVASSCDDHTLDFDALVFAHGRFVLNIAYSVLRNPQDAEDIAQETFFRAFRAGDLGKIEHMRGWLGRIAWRLALNHSRNRSEDRRKIRSEDLLRTLPAAETAVDEMLVRKERAILLERVLLSLPRDLRETFVLLTVEGMTSQNAAEILGIADSSVRDRLSRARKIMKEKLTALAEVNNEP